MVKMKKNEILKFCFAVYAGGLIIQNILATKQIDMAMFTVTTGVLVSPLIFIVQDVMSEVFGYREAKKMILAGFAMNFIGVLLFSLAILLPPSAFWENQVAFETVLGTTARISIASFTAYMVGSLVNVGVMVKLKEKFSKSLFIRAISSTLAGQFLDNALFAVVAFAFVLPAEAILSMIVGGTLFEVLYEVVFYPITKTAIMKAKRAIGQ